LENGEVAESEFLRATLRSILNQQMEVDSTIPGFHCLPPVLAAWCTTNDMSVLLRSPDKEMGERQIPNGSDSGHRPLGSRWPPDPWLSFFRRPDKGET
jgi:hypothetical protein